MVLGARCNVPQLRTIRLGVLAGDGSAWVGKKHNPRGWLTPSRDWELWTREVLEKCSDILTDAGILDAVKVTSRWIPAKAKESCRAIMELFCPATNTFITPNSELGFSLTEVCDVFGLPILREFYEEFNPLGLIMDGEIKEFRAIF
ncbi:hypothetical protein AAC387_Pa08g1640 [Persea americana]